MRNPHCQFDWQNNDKLICAWNEPEYKNGPIQRYHVWLTNRQNIIYEHETRENNFEWSHTFQHRGIYVIVVVAKTDKWSESASSTFQYNKHGKVPMFFRKAFQMYFTHECIEGKSP